MEYLWAFIASVLAGIGTGLAGLSAATVMVPILIVLCPSFSGEGGVYAATAIALFSDILGSAVTTSVYIKHKNIDFKHSYIMAICIFLMCILGSFVAYKVGNKVLGGFTLFLTLCIGIRFLLKPETKHKDGEIDGKKLTGKDIAISLFFGLTIGFGTGFVGTGGGMMMLVVFTFFLGMGLKTAVGTSTFIMTFTALIAGVSHALIEPSIIFVHWKMLLFCVVIATLSSLLSSIFANKVKSKTVGLITGGVLFILASAMIIINYRAFISSHPLLLDTLVSLGYFLLFIIVLASVLIILHFKCKIPPYIFRKLLHIVAFTSVVVMVKASSMWESGAIVSLLFALLVYPILVILEKKEWYSGLFVEKSKGEIKSSLLLLFGMCSFLIAILWGIFKERYFVIATILMWGVGDGAAAIIGKKWGKHTFKGKLSDGKKTLEGSLGMFITSFIVGFSTLIFKSNYSLLKSLIVVLIASFVGTAVEAISKKGMDTVTVPCSIAVILVLSKLLF